VWWGVLGGLWIGLQVLSLDRCPEPACGECDSGVNGSVDYFDASARFENPESSICFRFQLQQRHRDTHKHSGCHSVSVNRLRLAKPLQPPSQNFLPINSLVKHRPLSKQQSKWRITQGPCLAFDGGFFWPKLLLRALYSATHSRWEPSATAMSTTRTRFVLL
jgi:hypothetical protein